MPDHPYRRIAVILRNPKLGVHIFAKGSCPKENVVERQETELTYFKATMQYFNHYVTRINK